MLITISDYQVYKNWGGDVYLSLFEGLLSLDKTIKVISMSEDTVLEFDLLYGWHGEDC